MLVISSHADTGFRQHRLRRDEAAGCVFGHLDNFVGCHCVLEAYFSGGLDRDFIRIELTHGEEIDCAGAKAVRKTLHRSDLVIVVDVTATETERDFVIEKCPSESLRHFLHSALDGLSYDLYEDCPDPISDADETDVYATRCEHVFFLGVPCFGGDYNAGRVGCRLRSIEAVARALCRIADHFPAWCRERGISTR